MLEKHLKKIIALSIAVVLTVTVVAFYDFESYEPYEEWCPYSCEFLNSEFGVNQFVSILLNTKLQQHISDDIYGGTYIDEDGNLVILAVDEIAVANALAATYSDIQEQLTAIENLPIAPLRLEDDFNVEDYVACDGAPLEYMLRADVNTRTVQFSVAEIEEAKENLAPHMEQLGLQGIFHDVKENQLVLEAIKSESILAEEIDVSFLVNTRANANISEMIRIDEVEESIPHNDSNNIHLRLGARVGTMGNSMRTTMGVPVYHDGVRGWLITGHAPESVPGTVVRTGNCGGGTLGTARIQLWEGNGSRSDVAFVGQTSHTNVAAYRRLNSGHLWTEDIIGGFAGPVPQGGLVFMNSRRMTTIPAHQRRAGMGIDYNVGRMRGEVTNTNFTMSNGLRVIRANYTRIGGASGGPITVEGVLNNQFRVYVVGIHQGGWGEDESVPSYDARYICVVQIIEDLGGNVRARFR